MEKSSQTAWKIVPLRNVFTLKVVPLIEVLLYGISSGFILLQGNRRVALFKARKIGYLYATRRVKKARADSWEAIIHKFAGMPTPLTC
jgi:hypothetical protein